MGDITAIDGRGPTTSQFLREDAVVGRTVALRRVCILLAGICEAVRFQDKEKLMLDGFKVASQML